MGILDLEASAHCARCEPCLLGPFPEAQRDSHRESAAGGAAVDVGLSRSSSGPGVSRRGPQRLSGGRGPILRALGLEHSGADRPRLPWGRLSGRLRPAAPGSLDWHKPKQNQGHAEDKCGWVQLGAPSPPVSNTHTHTHTHTEKHTHRDTQRHTDTHTGVFRSQTVKGAFTTT